MSKPRYNWWSFALAIIRDYPLRYKQLKELRQQNMVAETTGMPKGGSAGRSAENVAMRQLPPQEQREFDAVHKALQRTEAMKAGKVRQQIVKLTLWQGYNIDTAAMIVHEAPATTRRYRWQFIMLVGHMYGFLTAEEYAAALKRDAVGGKLEYQSQKNVR